MVVVGFLFGELVALADIRWGIAMIIYLLVGIMAVAFCYGLFLVRGKVKLWDKMIVLCVYISILLGYVSYNWEAAIFEKYDKLQYGIGKFDEISHENSGEDERDGIGNVDGDIHVSVAGEVTAIVQKKYGYVVELKTTEGLIWIQLDDISEIKYGVMLSVSGIINPMKQADNQGNYDERSYLHSNGVILKVKVVDNTSVKIMGSSEDYSFIKNSLYKIKIQAMQILKQQCDEKEMGLLSAIVLGEKTYLDEGIKELYSANSIAHVLSISGVHISVIGMGIYHLLRVRMRYVSSGTISVVIMILFSIMIGNSVSAVRAVIMFVVHILGDILGRKYDMLSALSLSAFMLLWDNPYYITNASFLLSYSAMVAVAVTAPIVLNFLKADNNFVKTMIFNISLTFTSMPINMCLFYRVSTYSIVLNLMVVPLMGVMLVMAIVGMIVTAFSAVIGEACFGISVYILRFYEWLCNMAERLPASSVVTGSLSTEGILIYYVLFIFVLWIMAKKKHDIYEKANKTNKLAVMTQSNRMAVIMTVIIAMLISIMIFIVYRQKQDGFEICFLDVGQGDCAYIHSQNGSDYLIDGGSSDEENIGKYKLESFLEYKDVDKLEYVFISHCDTDHISGIMELIERGKIAIDNIVLPQTEKITSSENGLNIVTLAKENGIEILYFEKGSCLKDGELEFSCISPQSDEIYSDLNESSLVLFMKCKNIIVFFAGDIGIDKEQQLLDEVSLYLKTVKMKTEEELFIVYKVAHHGSKYSSSVTLLEVLKPNVAIISCGQDNSYGHPHLEVIDRLEASGAELFYTMMSGQVTFSTDKIKSKPRLKY